MFNKKEPLFELIDKVSYLREEISYHPVNSDVKPGCECGCGGNTLDWESVPYIGELENELNDCINSLINLCKEL